MDIQIGLPATLAMGVCGAVIPLLPVLLWIVWRRRTGAAWLPLGVGVLAYLFIGAARGVARLLFLGSMAGWGYYLGQALLAGIFEEGGRWLVFTKIMTRQDDPREAVSYGIGHGGLEHLLVSEGWGYLYGFFVAMAYRSGGMAAFADGLPALLMQGLDDAAIGEVVQGVAETSAVGCVLMLLESAGSLAVQCCWSVLVYTAVRRSDMRWLAAAFVTHIAADIVPALHFQSGLTVPETTVLRLLLEAGIIYLTYRVWEKTRETSISS